MAWPLSEERLGVCLSLPWCSPTRWTGMRLGTAWLDFVPQCAPRGLSVKNPRRGTSRVTHVTMVPWEGTRCCAHSPCLRPACLRLLQTTKLVTYSAGSLLYFRAPAMWTNRIGVISHVLQTPVMLTVFPNVPSRGAASRALLGNHGYMCNPRRFHILFLIWYYWNLNLDK